MNRRRLETVITLLAIYGAALALVGSGFAMFRMPYWAELFLACSIVTALIFLGFVSYAVVTR